MRTMMKRLGLALLLAMALTLLLAPAALADGGHAKDFSDFDETDWENFWAGGMTICPECENWCDESDCCEECFVCWECLMDSTDHCPRDGMHGWEEDTWCEACGSAPCCNSFEIAEELGYGVGTLCDHCIKDSGLDFEHCQECLQPFEELHEMDYCTTCFMCYNCHGWVDHCTWCGDCSDEICACTEHVCHDCHDFNNWYCPLCDIWCMFGTPLCTGADTHCIECCRDQYLCSICGTCFYENEEEFCWNCLQCISCSVEEGMHCPECSECFGAIDPCGDGSYCENCCPDLTGEHCWTCGEHAGADGKADWCEEGGEGTHCQDCMIDYCENCEVCFECDGGEACDICGMCIDCCLEYSESEGCVCGMCVEDSFFEEHLYCIECGTNLCENDLEICDQCGFCLECCVGYSESEGCVCGMCVEDSDFEGHLACPDCDFNLCESGEELCDLCGLCPDCCLTNSEDRGCVCEMCVEDSEFDEHVECPDCGAAMCELGLEYCDLCGACDDCCLENSEDGGCVCGMCVEEIGYEAHVMCRGCKEGLCARGLEPCIYCGMCEECCLEHQCKHGICYANTSRMKNHTCELCGECFDEEDLCATCKQFEEISCKTCCVGQTAVFGCDHGVCMNDVDAWLAHWCYSCGTCAEECYHGTPYGGHPATPERNYSTDAGRHWRDCRYCDEIEHRTEMNLHTFRNGVCRYCGVRDLSSLAPVIVKQPRHVHVDQPDPGEPDVTVSISATVACAGESYSYQWQKIVDGYYWMSVNVSHDRVMQPDGSWKHTMYTKAGSDLCLKADENHVAERYRLRVWNDHGSENSDLAKVTANHNKLGFAYLDPDAPGYEGKARTGKGLHWPACSICGEGEKRNEAEPHTGTWKTNVTGDGYYVRTCDLCGYEETAYATDPIFTGSPENVNITLPHDPEEDMLVLFSIPHAVTPTGEKVNDYEWWFSYDGLEWSRQYSDIRGKGVIMDNCHDVDLHVYVTSEAPCDGTKFYFRCGVEGTEFYSNMAALTIKCNQLGYDYAEQDTNNAIGMVNSELLMDKHWIACSGCRGNDDTLKHGEHEFGDWMLDESIGLLYHECEICGYYEREYGEDEFHFSTNPRSIFLTDPELGDRVTLTAIASGTDQDVYYMWIRPWFEWISYDPPLMRMVEWEILEQGLNKTTHNYYVDDICTDDELKKKQNLIICFAKEGEPIDPYEYNWGEGVIASNYIEIRADHNQDAYNYDDVYHWPCCDLCFENDDFDKQQPHDMSDWLAVSSTGDAVLFERSCICGYTETQTSSATVWDASIYGIARPAPGITPDVQGTLSEAGSGKTHNMDIKWYELNEDGEKILPELGETTTFKKNTVYRLEVTLRAFAGTGYSFEVGDAKINDETAEVYYPTEGIGVVNLYVDYDTSNCISSVSVYDILQPLSGNTVDFEARVPAADYSLMTVISTGKQMLSWYFATTEGGEQIQITSPSATYDRDCYYTFNAYLQADEGKWFAVDENGKSLVTARVNGNKVSSRPYDSLTYGTTRQLKVTVDFGKPEVKKGSILVAGHALAPGQYLWKNAVYDGTPWQDNSVSFDGTKLTMKNFSCTVDESSGISSSKPLIIELIGKNSITTTGNRAAINVAGNLVFEGSGSLDVTANKDGLTVNEGNLIMESGVVRVNAERDALYLGNYYDSECTAVVNGGYLGLDSSGSYGIWMLSSTDLRVNGGILKVSGENWATNTLYAKGLIDIMVGDNVDELYPMPENGILSDYRCFRIAHTKDTTFYITERPVDMTYDCGPDAMETVNFRVNSDSAEYTWYLDVGDGNGFRTALEQADSGKAALGGWDDPELSVNALITSAKAYCVATVGPETFTSNTVTITLVHDYTEFTSTGDVDTHSAYCQRCFEKYPHEHMRRYKILSEATQYVAGSYRFDCVLCGYASTSYGFGIEKVQDGAKLIFDWNDGLGTQTEVEVTQFTMAEVAETPVREGYIFLGWAVNPNATEPDYTGNEVSVSIVEPVTTLYAIWKPYDYTIDGWVTSNGTAEKPVTVKIDLYKLGSDEVTGEETETLQQSIEVVNDDAGLAERYTFEMLWPGKYRIKAAADGYVGIEEDIWVVDYSVTKDLRMVRPDITRMDFTVENLSAGKACDKIKVTTDTVGIAMSDIYGVGYRLYTDEDGSVGDALGGGKIEGGKFYWVRVDYTIDDEYSIDWYNYSHVMNGCIVSTNYDMSDNCYAYFRMYVPTNGAEATGTLDIGCYGLPEAFSQADAYPYFSLSGTLNGMLVDQMWMKGEEWFAGTFEQGETYTLYASVMMSDGSKVPEGVYVTVNGEAPTSIEYSGNLLIVTKDYKVDSMTTFKLPAAITTIEAEAFEGSVAEAFEIPAGCTSIGSRAFANCPNLKVLIIRSSSIAIADDALEGNFEATGACRVTIISPADSDLPSWCKQHGVNWQPLN